MLVVSASTYNFARSLQSAVCIAIGLLLCSLSHSLGERSHTIEKHYNARTAEREEHHEFVNLDESRLCVINHL